MWSPTSKYCSQKAFQFGTPEFAESNESSFLKQKKKKKQVHYNNNQKLSIKPSVSKKGRPTPKYRIGKKCSPSLTQPPVSQFENGFKPQCAPFNQKDYRHKMYYTAISCGVLLLWFEKATKVEEPYLLYDYNQLRDHHDLKTRLGILGVCDRKGAGKEPLKQSESSKYPWKQLIVPIAGHHNTPDGRKHVVSKILNHMNINQNEQNYKYPQKIRLANDLTPKNGPIPPADTRLLDQDVVNLMISCYPHVSLHELLQYEDIMCQFWSDSKHGLETTLCIGGINDNESEIGPPDSPDDDSSSMTSTQLEIKPSFSSPCDTNTNLDEENQSDEESSAVFLDHDTNNNDDDSFIPSDDYDDDYDEDEDDYDEDEDEDDDSSSGDVHESFICSVEHDSAADEEDEDDN
jgi:hypothetical protein